MLQDSAANNSALAMTIDVFENGYNKMNRNPLERGHLNEELKSDYGQALEDINYKCQEAKIDDLDISDNKIQNQNACLSKIATCRICLQEGEILGEKYDDYDELLVENP